MKKICYIIGAGDVYPTESKAHEQDLIICADGGYEHRCLLGRPEDLVVGDFDSLGRVPQTEHTVVAPCEKDETDMMLAVEEGLKRGYDRFVIFGALGGSRKDHSVANIQLLSFLCSRGAKGCLIHGDEVFFGIRNSGVSFAESCRGYVSVFSLCDESRGVDISGLKYEVKSFTLRSDYPLGVSNEFTGRRSRVSVTDGVLLVTAKVNLSDVDW